MQVVSNCQLCTLFTCILLCISTGPLLIRYLHVKYAINNYNFSEILCQVGENISSRVTDNCKKILESALYDYRTYNTPILIHSDFDSTDLPSSFDARKHWPRCASLNEIRDQGACGSCWAIAVASTITDRLCIYSEGKITTSISAEDLLTCCHECGSGCNGGNPFDAWNYWKKIGIVSGGSYGQLDGCKPYTIQPCFHRSSNNCSDFIRTPMCQRTCRHNYEKSYWKDKRFGRVVYSILSNEKQIMKEIMSNGPVQTQMSLYDDFLQYSSGIYSPSTGNKAQSYHSLKIIGWGTDESTDTNYWLGVNSFNKRWGENGFLRIKRGDTCSFETSVHAGIPDF